ncbi:MAG: redoxin domain-containing protein [Gammaproteobacteria bacterium]
MGNWRERMRRVQWKSHAVTLLLVIVVVYGVNAWRTQEVPEAAPEFAGSFIDGAVTGTGAGTITLAEFRARHAGKPVALHFWAEWCPVCRTEEHSISRLARNSDTPVLTIAMQSGDVAAVRQVLTERNLHWPTVVDEHGDIARAYRLPGVPSFVVLDAHGRVYSADMGYTSEIGMRARLWLAGRRGGD